MRRQSQPDGDLGQGQCSWQKAGGGRVFQKQGQVGGRRQGPGCVGPGRQQWGSRFFLTGARGSRWEAVGRSVCQEKGGEQPRGSDEIEEMRACSPGSGVHGHDPLIFPGEGQSWSRRAKTCAMGPLLSNQASPG